MATLPLTVPIYNVSAEAQHLAIILVLIHTAFAIILWPSAFVMPNVLRAGGDVKYTLAVSVFSMGMFRIVFSYIFALGLPRRDRRVVRHGNGLGVPCIYVRRTVSLRKMDRRKPCKMSIDKADFTMLQ